MVCYMAMGGGGGGGGGYAVAHFLVFGFWFSVFRFLVFARGLAHCLVCSAVLAATGTPESREQIGKSLTASEDPT